MLDAKFDQHSNDLELRIEGLNREWEIINLRRQARQRQIEELMNPGQKNMG